MNELKIIECTPKVKRDYFQLHMNALIEAVNKIENSYVDRRVIYKVVNHGVRSVTFGKTTHKHDTNAIILFSFIELIKHCISVLTPRELTTIFPVDKIYDGDKWQAKDYFYTMRVLEEHGLDTPIGENVTELLWDYVNGFIRDFLVTYMCTASKLYREQTGVGIMEEWAINNGIPLHHECKDPNTGQRFMFDKENGRTQTIIPQLPRNWKIHETRKGLLCKKNF